MEEKDVQRLIDMLYNMIDEAKSAAPQKPAEK